MHFRQLLLAVFLPLVVLLDLAPTTALARDVAPIRSLTNGGSISGRISPTLDTDTYIFRASIGEGIQLRVADTGPTALSPQMLVYRPDGSLLTSGNGAVVAQVYFSAPVTGNYRVVVQDQGGGADTGPYRIFYTRAPGANEHGTLVNGGVVSQQIGLGDLDSYTFDAYQGEGVQLRMADTGGTSLHPQMWVYRPDGSYYTSAWAGDVVQIYFDAPASGVYTLVVMDQGTSGFADTGDYEIRYTRAPGANEHGMLVNGGVVSEQIELGDLDSYTFTAGQGEGVQLRMADTGGTSLHPQMWVYRPDGSYYTSAWAGDVAQIYFDAPVSGVYTLVVMDQGTGGYGDTGAYELRYTRAPGASEHGALVNGGVVSEQIDLGDLDSYTFTAGQGEGVQLRMTDTGGTSLHPHMWVYRPDGSYYTSAWAGDVAQIYFDAPVSGVYTLVVMDQGTSGYADTGAYEIRYTRAPGASEHGALVNGGVVSEQIELGDLDSYTFTAGQGEGVQLRMADTGGSSLQPHMWVYRPDGSYYTSAWAGDVAQIYFDAPVSGVYTLVVMDQGTSGYADTGAYELRYTRAPGANEHGSLVSGGIVTEFIDQGDLDSFTFTALAGQQIQLDMIETGSPALHPHLWVYRPNGSYYTSAWGGAVAMLDFAAPDAGTYTVVVMDQGTSGYADTGAYELHFTRL